MNPTLILLLTGRAGQVLHLLAIYCQKYGHLTVQEITEEADGTLG